MSRFQPFFSASVRAGAADMAGPQSLLWNCRAAHLMRQVLVDYYSRHHGARKLDPKMSGAGVLAIANRPMRHGTVIQASSICLA